MNSKEVLLRKLNEKKARMAVLGLGYVGLPLAVVFAEAGFEVIGIDPDMSKVDTLNEGVSYIPDVSSEDVDKLIKSGLLKATTDFSILKDVEAVSICVPTPLRKTGDPDMSYIDAATSELAKYVHAGMVIVLESTTYPGTTREFVLPILTEKNDLVVGEDFFLCFSPERVDPGREDWTTINTPKVLGGVTEACGEVADAWYSAAIETVVPVSSAEAAEMSKLLENTFRMINIGLVNELAIMCDRLNVDVWEVIDAAATKPFGFMKFTPGPGLGGHCIPIDPLYLSWKMKAVNYNARFIELASEINTGMPRYVSIKVQDALNEHRKAIKGSKILILGAAYKPDIDDLRESPALDVIALLAEKGADVSYHDPYCPSLQTNEGEAMESVPDMMASVRTADCVVIITNHSDYDYDAILADALLIVDTRNALGKAGRNNSKVFGL
ncbi:MAG: nucleotide sugar dehydrogenase [Anaerolineales bacterium]|uniref:Nucleotide sugar dehydrogenase n=1 Tax=Candidatus Desulfolinea nitratireducens TaxID=2841698 RepID=A0A8J6NJW3_9CHLR|nr:nucleotide sugar dehydrogenase [Candidatus Desulfolinea nitratireducens]MBL6961844.1 nucleotide sugar dehydrogenase [Anaerolineales bacterium]